MVNKAIKAANKAIKSHDDKRIGAVWHTTGSGKSLSMAFFTSIAAWKLNNPTFWLSMIIMILMINYLIPLRQLMNFCAKIQHRFNRVVNSVPR